MVRKTVHAQDAKPRFCLQRLSTSNMSRQAERHAKASLNRNPVPGKMKRAEVVARQARWWIEVLSIANDA